MHCSMFKGKERDTGEEREGGLGKYGYCLSKKARFDGNPSNGYWGNFGCPPPQKIRICEMKIGLDRNWLTLCSGYDSRHHVSSGVEVEPQDADYSQAVPSLSYELEALILARVPRSEYWKLCFVNKRYLDLLRSGELFKIRRDIGVKESSVFILATGETVWWAFDREFKSRRKLPVLPTDFCFTSGDKESVCAGSHLLVSGREIDGLVLWRYELGMNKWYKGPSMINPRCLFASASSGPYAFVAGGIGIEANSEVYNTAEKYNPDSKSWEPLPRMKRRRKLCSGCYIDNRFYVIGGRNENGALTCGEFFNEARNNWVLIPDMLKDDPVLNCHSPPLVAVVNNELYSLEASSNQLKVYLKKSNTWKHLGSVPVRADSNRGWGVAFKSLGNELLVIGSSCYSVSNCMAIYTCCPNPDAEEELQWMPLDSGRNRHSPFILNCSVMVA
ncbi:F-box/kelch-repeat protein At3g27150-like [Cornus florida]|uniref:F-box/kelch-repeat protein At3g27150-like n=1 Tax=Cornus florida TaxID=4283 RepID=UPI00289F30F4|nr:F-box/kelch-repeat protein At3g27150-like [Cornus florida]